MSKQDGYASRTAADLERKYNFGKSFAEIYNLASDARSAAIEAKNAYEGLTTNEIFNLLTDFGESQGVYRDDTGNVYVNASFIKSGKLEGTDLKVAAAIVEGELSAATIKADKISGGELDFNKVTAKNLTIGNGLPDDIAKVSDILTKTSQLTNDSNFMVNDVADAFNKNGVLVEYSKMTGITEIIGGVVTADFIETLGLVATSVVSRRFDSAGGEVGRISVANGSIEFGTYGEVGAITDQSVYGYGNILTVWGNTLWLQSNREIRLYVGDGFYWELGSFGMIFRNPDGSYVKQFLVDY